MFVLCCDAPLQNQRISKELEAKEAQCRKLLSELSEQVTRAEQLERTNYEATGRLALLQREVDELRAEKERAQERARSSELERDEHLRKGQEVKSKAQDTVKLYV